MVELRSLAYFVTACQHESLARAAEQMGIALSTLSVSLKALEDELGLELFRRTSAGLYPTDAARWLFRAALPLLLMEAFARRSLARRKPVRPHMLTVETSLNFTLGRISNAILRASEMLAAEKPQVLVDPIWVAEPDAHQVDGIADGWQGAARSRMRIEATDEDAEAFCVNAINLGRRLVMAQAPRSLKDRLAAHGFQVAEVDLSPFILSGGAAYCMTLRLDRQTAPQAARYAAE